MHACDVYFNFNGLPAELQTLVVLAAPDEWTAISLRLTSKRMNAIYLEVEDKMRIRLRNEIVAPIYDYYDFLSTLHVPPSAVIHPPKTGWPNLGKGVEGEWKKSDLAMDVLRHMPYITPHERHHDNYHNIDYKCNVVDNSKWKSGVEPEARWDENLIIDSEGDGLGLAYRNIIMIAMGYESYGVCLTLNVQTGEIREDLVRAESLDFKPIAEYLASKKQNYRDCQTVFLPDEDPLFAPKNCDDYDEEEMAQQGEPKDSEKWDRGEEDYYWVRHLYMSHGWPSPGWRRTEGLAAVKAFAEREREDEENEDDI